MPTETGMREGFLFLIGMGWGLGGEDEIQEQGRGYTLYILHLWSSLIINIDAHKT